MFTKHQTNSDELYLELSINRICNTNSDHLPITSNQWTVARQSSYCKPSPLFSQPCFQMKFFENREGCPDGVGQSLLSFPFRPFRGISYTIPAQQIITISFLN